MLASAGPCGWAGVLTEDADRLALAKLRSATDRLLGYFTPKTGRWRTPTQEAWQPALAVEAVINTYERTREVAYLNVVEKSFARYRGRRSRFYDDDGWYLNAWLRAFDVTGDPKYLAEAEQIFAGMTDAWDEVCGGGVWWSRDRMYKNAITNELFLLAAARLHRRTSNPSYLEWALREWAWFDASAMINETDLVNDGLDGSCANNGETTWTYNQGVILSALVELWRITGDRDHLLRARRIAQATMATQVHPGGILREPCEPSPENKDAQIFKGIFAQGLARLHAAEGSSDGGSSDGREVASCRAFLTANADAVWDRGRDAKGGLGLSWAGPAGRVTAATHASASLLLGEVALLHAGGATIDIPATGGTVYEAEEATLGGIGPEAVFAGYTGSGYVAFWHRDGQYVSFDVTVPSARIGTLTFRYAAGAGDAYRYLEVGGVGRADAMLFAGTLGWDSYSTVSFDVPLRRGSTTVSLVYDSWRASTNFLNLDNLRVR